MKQLKSMMATALLAAFLAGPAMAQEKKEAPMKEHKCTAACKSNKHVYAHGEKGHTCGAECKKMASKGKA